MLRGRRGLDLVKKGGRVEGQLLGSICLWGGGWDRRIVKYIVWFQGLFFLFALVWAESITSSLEMLGVTFPSLELSEK